ncbi:MAG: ATP-dependent sacrificial sulfur transferase LarE [Desulfobulbaceae bacterium]|nr:ATP-dependent sacrificial sulfur transferase LarE [Desulfobulbaceae bacterium]
MLPLDSKLAGKYDALCADIAEKAQVAVAFSGGVDSTLLLKAAMDATGGKAIALLAATPLQPESETRAAINTATALGAELHVRELDPLLLPEFVENPPDRCYHCKKAIYSDFTQYISRQPDTTLLDGTNIDDLQEERPGRRAISELAVATPLVEANLDKHEIRTISKTLQLATWNKPSASCLATRITTGQYIDKNKLALIASCEAHLHDLGVQDCRVRLGIEDNALIELISHDFNLLSSQEIRTKALLFFKSMGIRKVFLDLSERKSNV